MAVSDGDLIDFGISFESQPKDTYGDNYSMDISDISVLDFSHSWIGLSSTVTDITSLTLKLYKANITNEGIELISNNGGTISNTNVTVTDCDMNNDYGAFVYFHVYNYGTISNSSITVTDCNINSNSSVGIQAYANGGTISNSSVIVTDCNINSRNVAVIGLVNNNTTIISNSVTSISNTTIEHLNYSSFVDQQYINDITLDLDNIIVTNQ